MMENKKELFLKKLVKVITDLDNLFPYPDLEEYDAADFTDRAGSLLNIINLARFIVQDTPEE